MTPLVIGLAAVVMVILIVVVVGMRYVRNEERADLADREEDGGRPERERGRTKGRQTPDWRQAGQQPAPLRPPGREPDGARQRRAGAAGYDERPGRGADRGYGAADRGLDDRRHDGAGRAARGHNGRDELARPQQQEEALPQLRARQPRGRRNDDGDWPSTEWDKLSDADYWKEVASDKPLTTTARIAQPAQQPHPGQAAQAVDAVAAGHAGQVARAGTEPRRGPDLRRGVETRRGPEPRLGQEPRTDAARVPGRGALEPAAAGAGPDFLTAPAAVRFPEYGRPQPVLPGPSRPEQPHPELARPELARPEQPHPELARPELARPQAAQPRPGNPGSRPAGQPAAAPMPYDDDPLTSPSFPRIVTSDSRSYGNGRPSGSASRPSGPAEQADYGAPTTQFASYAAASSGPADGRGANGYDRGFADGSATTAPHSYGRAPQPPAASYPPNGQHPAGYGTGAGSGAPAGQQQPARPPAARPLPAAPPPAGNPYGSYVSAELPGYADNPTAAYPRGQAARDYPGYPAGSANGNAAPAYSYDLPLSDSAPPLGQARSWYPEVPPAMAPAPSPVAPAPLPHHDRYPNDRISGHDNGNGQRSPSGYAPGPYSDGQYDVPGYPSGGYGVRPAAPAYPPAGADSARQLDPAGYLPPDFYGGDGYGGQRR